jgi:integrase
MDKPKRRYRQHGSGSVIKTGEGRYRIGHDNGAKGTARKQHFETVRGAKRKAEDRLRELLDQAHKNGFPEDDVILFKDLATRFLDAKRISREATTLALYERVLKMHVLPSIGAVRVRDLKAAHIQALLSSAVNHSRTKQGGKSLGATTLRNVRIVTRAVLAFGVKQGVLLRNVGDLVEPPALPHNERALIGVADLRKLLEAAQGTELEAIVPFAIGTGLRRGEICALRWGDVDLSTGQYSLKRAAKIVDGKVVIGHLKTKKSVRTDVLPAFVIAILEKHRQAQAARHKVLGSDDRDADGFVFDRLDGQPWNPNEMSRMFSRLVRRKKLPAIRFHDLRHSYATLAFAAGVPMKVVSESLGHSSIGITSAIYVHVGDDSKREKSEKLDAFLSSATSSSGAAGEA